MKTKLTIILLILFFIMFVCNLEVAGSTTEQKNKKVDLLENIFYIDVRDTRAIQYTKWIIHFEIRKNMWRNYQDGRKELLNKISEKCKILDYYPAGSGTFYGSIVTDEPNCLMNI